LGSGIGRDLSFCIREYWGLIGPSLKSPGAVTTGVLVYSASELARAPHRAAEALSSLEGATFFSSGAEINLESSVGSFLLALAAAHSVACLDAALRHRSRTNSSE